MTRKRDLFMQTDETMTTELDTELDTETVPEEEAVPENVPMQTLSEPDLCRAIEAILFAAGYPMSYEKLARTLGGTAGEMKRRVRAMAERYNAPERESGLLLLAMDDVCQLCTNEAFMPFIRVALGIRRGGNLSNSSLETLAIVAYNQPTTRSYIDTVRGVDSSYAVNSLIEKHLIEPCGRLDVPGRPILYRTTADFLRVFGMQDLRELPEVGIEHGGAEGEIIPLDIPEGEGAPEVASEEANA